MKRRRWDTTGWSKTALRIQRQLRRKQEPPVEDLLALVGEMRDMVIPPEWRKNEEPPEDVTSRVAPAASVDDFESNVVVEALRSLHDDMVRMQAARYALLTDQLVKAYHNLKDASAREPENTELAGHEKKLREILEKGFRGRIPTLEELAAEWQWAEEEEQG